MQQLKRRKSNYRQSERKHDFSNLLNKMIIDNNDNSLRQSIKPLAQQQVFQLISQQKRLSNQALTSLLKLIQKEVLIIGIILPLKLLKRCWQLLSGSKQSIFYPNNVNCGILYKNMIAKTNTVIFMIDQGDIMDDKKMNVNQKLILNLSLVLITDYKVLLKKLTQWQSEDYIFEKNSTIMIISEQGDRMDDQLIERIQSIFWNINIIFVQDLQRQIKFSPKNNYLLPQRQAYHKMYDEEEQQSKFISQLRIISQISLKKNWKISKGLFCYPFLYLLNVWIIDQLRDPRVLLESSLLSYCKSLEDQFSKFVENFKLPIDQLKFRNTLQIEKKQILFNARKHITMLENIFSKFQFASKSLEGLDRFLTEKSRQIYETNITIATKMNKDLLQNLYQEIINKKFFKENSQSIDEFQNDFKQLLDIYGSKSYRVSSQLKTFNQFFMQKKFQYTENLSKELQIGKKKYYSQRQELQDRLEIQTGVLQTLQTELKQLEEKRKKIDLQNALLKATISQNFKKKQQQNFSQFNSTSRKKYLEVDRKITKISAKQYNKNKQQANKTSKCCCQIM